MKNKRKNFKTFFRTFYLSSVLLFCILTAVFGISLAYENTMITGFGEYKKAVEITDSHIRILDFDFDLNLKK